MGDLIYTAITSLDGYVADQQGNFDWAAPDAEVHAFVNDLARQAGIHLYGRRMYDVMRFWETVPAAEAPGEIRDFAHLWKIAEKVVFTTTLTTVSTSNTRMERDFDPDSVLRLKASTERKLTVGGPNLAAQALRAGLVDEIHLLLTPVVVGGGTPALPRDLRARLELLNQRRFHSGVVHLHHRVVADGVPGP